MCIQAKSSNLPLRNSANATQTLRQTFRLCTQPPVYAPPTSTYTYWVVTHRYIHLSYQASSQYGSSQRSAFGVLTIYYFSLILECLSRPKYFASAVFDFGRSCYGRLIFFVHRVWKRGALTSQHFEMIGVVSAGRRASHSYSCT